MKRILCGAVFVSAILLAAPFSSARAADLGVKVPAPPPPPPAYSWTGFYVGGQGGFAWAYPDLTIDSGLLTQQSTSFSNQGGFGGGLIGAQYEFGWTHIVAGIEAEYNGGSIKGNATSTIQGLTAAGGPLTVTLAQSATLNSFGSVDGRLGVALVGFGFDHMLLYITGGVAFGDPKQTATAISSVGAAAPAFVAGTTATFGGGDKTGWDFGAGIDYWLTTNWIVRGEWRMYNFPSLSVSVPGGLVAAGPAAAALNTSETVNVARAGIIYKF
jgi:outer membrane immunogenic protein